MNTNTRRTQLRVACQIEGAQRWHRLRQQLFKRRQRELALWQTERHNAWCHRRKPGSVEQLPPSKSQLSQCWCTGNKVCKSCA
jgi:hypothetical protein